MALVLADRVKETTASTGTGTITLDGAALGFQSFSVIGDGNTTYYTIASNGSSEWEVGIGTYTSSGTTLSRDTVLASSAGAPNKTSFSAGTKDVFVTYPAERSVYSNGTNIVPDNAAVLLPSSGGTGQSSLTANNVILGNGTSAVQFVAPGSSGNVLTSNGTTWTSGASPGFPAGTAMLFVQTTAPTGWTKSTTHDNKALRVVSGSASSGGSVAFTTAFASQSVTGTVGDTTLTSSQIPSHTHSFSANTSSVGNHTHTPVTGVLYSEVNDPAPPADTIVATAGAGSMNATATLQAKQYWSQAGGHDHSVSGTSGATGSGGSHNHTFTGTAINLAVQYVDVIIATKD